MRSHEGRSSNHPRAAADSPIPAGESSFPGRRLESLFLARAQSLPDHPAVVHGETVWTYGQLEARSRQIAQALVEGGVEAGSRVAVVARRDGDMVAALLGTLRAGCAYVPLDPAYPEARLAFMLADSAAAAVLEHRGLSPSGARGQAPTIALEDIGEGSEAELPAIEDPSRLAYVIYTSGSTGRPKGVAIEHRSAAAMLAWGARIYSPAELARSAAVTSICFDLSIYEIFLPLAVGGSVVLFDNALAIAQQPSPPAITLLNTVPSALRELLHLGAVPESVTTVNLAGEALRRNLVNEVYALPHIERVFNLYGPSEDTTYSTWSLVERDPEAPVTIGEPIDGTAGHVLDGRLEAVEEGELCLAGDGLARGYLGRPGLTAAVFVPNPFAATPGTRLYRTGDRVRRRADGRLDFLGRFDQQVKVRGYRIELGEIETLLNRQREVEEAVVEARLSEASTGDLYLVAYWVARQPEPVEEAETEGEPTIDQMELSRRLAQSLPAYALPARWVRLEALPRTPNGKVDRKALPAVEIGREHLTTPFRKADTPTQEAIGKIFSEQLALETVGVDDDLFELGAHSLVATRIAARIRSHFEVDLPAAAPFHHRTVRALAAEVEGLLASPAKARRGISQAPLTAYPRDGRRLPLSYPQEQVWLIHRLDKDNLAYNFQYTVRFHGPLAAPILQRALSEIVRRHESLRTTFPAIDGEPYQLIHPPYEAEMPLVDLTALPSARSEALAEELAQRLVRKSFDITRLPLMEWTLLRLSADHHLFVQSEQHFVHDGWSIGVFLSEIESHYKAFAAGQPSPLPELAVQFGDYALWQREMLSGDFLERQLDYWRDRLADPPPPLEVPTDRPRQRRQRFRGHRLDLDVSPRLYGDLLAVGRREGWTLFMLMLTAFEVLLGRYSQRQDFLLGSGVANRRDKAVEPLIGMVVNTLVLRADLSGEPTFRQLLERIREEAFGLQENADLPFERLVAEVQPERDLSRNPLFQHMFSFHDAPVPDLDFEPIRGELKERHNGSAKSDFNVIVKPRGSQRKGRVPTAEDQVLRVLWEYSTDLFDRATVERAWGHFNVLLRSLVENRDQPIWSAPLLTASERRQLEAWNDTAPAVTDLDLVAAILGHGRNNPGSLAIAAGDVRYTYGELTEKALDLAGRLRRSGIDREQTVAIALPASPDLVVAQLAVLAAGGAYLPIDPGHPAERLEFVLADSRASVLLTSSALAEGLPAFEGRVVPLPLPADEGAPKEPPLPRPHPRQTAYIIYTSGSTGRPKGTRISHGGLSNLVAWHGQTYDLSPADRTTLIASPAFDASVWELWPSLARGASLHVPPPELRADPRNLLRWLARERITVSFVPTPVAEEMIIEEPPEGLALRALLTGGDRLHNAPEGPLPFALVNHYGPTEDSVVTTADRVALQPKTPPIGVPIDGHRVHLLDPCGEVVPVGVPGEISIAGAGLALGYLDRPALTAERFIPDPFSPSPGGRLYRTGDQARRLPDGRLDFIGRRDGQVQVRGLRIEVGEVEAALEDHPGIRRAAVVPVAVAGRGATGLAAFLLVTGAGDLQPRPADWLARRLPDYMVPASFEVLDEMPLTPNQKIDRRHLEEVVAGRSQQVSAERRTAPRDPGEGLIAEIFAGVLGRESAGSLGIHDDFFGLGGHSLLAAKVVARISDGLGIEVSLPDLFENPTVAGLSSLARRRLTGGAAAEPLERRPDDEQHAALPLSFAQERLWLVDQLIERRSTYHIARAYRCRGAFSPAAMEAALSRLVERHESLRTVLENTDQGPRQRVIAAPPLRLQIVDLAAEGEARDLQMRRLVEEPFDLAQAPLLRATVLRQGPRDHLLLLVLHHLVADGWSMPLLLAELGDHYGASLEGRPATLPPLPVQYGDFALWQRRRLDSAAMEPLGAFWRDHLAGAPERLDLPTDFPRPPRRSLAGGRYSSSLGVEATEGLRRFSAERGATLFMGLLAVLSTLLSRWAGQRDVVVGTPIAGRPRKELEELIGFFVNTLPLRTLVAAEDDFSSLVEATRRTTLAAFAHQEMPFERLVELLEIDRDLSQSPLFQAMLALEVAGTTLPELTGCEVSEEAIRRHEAHFELTLFARERQDGGLDLSWSYDRDLWREETIARLDGHFSVLLAAALEDPDRPLARLPLLSPAERWQVTGGWNPALAAASDSSLVERVLEQARHRPEAIALSWSGGTMSYGELVARAAALADRLRAHGGGRIAPETTIGLCLGRSPEAIVAKLAVLGVGGVCVFLDPTHPSDRLAWLLADSGVEGILSRPRDAAHLPPTVEPLMIDLDDLGKADPETLSGPAGADSLASIIYTSGSTGRPKGVALSHRNLLRLVSHQDYLLAAADQTFLCHAPLVFDASFIEIWGALVHGHRLAIAPPGPLTLDELAATVRRLEVTTLFLTTGLFNQMVEGHLDELADLASLITGGEAASPALFRRASEAFAGGARLVNAYGPTENATITTCEIVDQPLTDGTLTIGKAIAGTTVYITDEALQPVPIGVVGELVTGGHGVARGYHGRPGRTAESFVPDPFGERAGGRLYRTGDLARWRSDGRLEFVGRRDGQVKLRGFRIELGEIESSLGRLPEVSAAAAILERRGEASRIVAFVVPREQTAVTGDDLRRALGERLPSFMVPDHIRLLDRLPLTRNGKIDREALPSLAADGPREPVEAPRNAMEERLLGIWRELLPEAPEGIRDDFFALGGQSLLATRLIARVRRELGVELRLPQFFHQPTVAGLAAAIAAAREAAGDTASAATPGEAPSIPRAARRRLVREGSRRDGSR